jgi:hypothetical protein
MLHFFSNIYFEIQIKNIQEPGPHSIVLTQKIFHLYEKTQHSINHFNNLKR